MAPFVRNTVTFVLQTMWHSAAEPLKVKGHLYLLQKIYLQTKFYAKSERRFYGNEIRFFTVCHKATRKK